MRDFLGLHRLGVVPDEKGEVEYLTALPAQPLTNRVTINNTVVKPNKKTEEK